MTIYGDPLRRDSKASYYNVKASPIVSLWLGFDPSRKAAQVSPRHLLYQPTPLAVSNRTPLMPSTSYQIVGRLGFVDSYRSLP